MSLSNPEILTSEINRREQTGLLVTLVMDTEIYEIVRIAVKKISTNILKTKYSNLEGFVPSYGDKDNGWFGYSVTRVLLFGDFTPESARELLEEEVLNGLGDRVSCSRFQPIYKQDKPSSCKS